MNALEGIVRYIVIPACAGFAVITIGTQVIRCVL